MKDNYCETCKFQFRDRASFMTHIKMSHSQDKTPIQSQPDLGHPRKVEIMSEDKLLAYYLNTSSRVRERYGLEKKETTFSIRDRKVYDKLPSDLKRGLLRALSHLKFDPEEDPKDFARKIQEDIERHEKNPFTL